MIVVADTSPLNYLVRLERVELLQLLYRRVIVPIAVITELQHTNAPGAVSRWAAAPPQWLEVRAVSAFDKTLPPELGLGEREAISLALQLHAETLLIDELAGRQQATARQLVVAGTLAVLVRAALSDQVVISDELRKLRHLGFRMSATLERDTLTLYHRLRTKRGF